MQSQIRRHRTRPLIRLCTICLNNRKLRVTWNILKSPFRTIFFSAYTQRQSTHQCCQCFDFVLWCFTNWVREPLCEAINHFVVLKHLNLWWRFGSGKIDLNPRCVLHTDRSRAMVLVFVCALCGIVAARFWVDCLQSSHSIQMSKFR